MSTTVVLVEQRPPFILVLASRIPTYTHIIISLLAVLLFQAVPSWTIAKPPVREFTRKRRSASVTSNATTLVDPDEVEAVKKDMDEQGKEKRHRVSFSEKKPFNKLGSSVKMAISRSKAVKPKLSRRLTLPARRFSTHIVTALHNLTPHRRPQDDSYFSLEKNNAGDVTVADNVMAQSDIPNSPSKPLLVSVVQTTKVEANEGDAKQRESYITIETPHKRRVFKQLVRRASVIFGDIVQRS